MDGLRSKTADAGFRVGDRISVVDRLDVVEGWVLSVHPVRSGGWEVVVGVVEAGGRNTRTLNVTITSQRCPMTLLRRAMDATS